MLWACEQDGATQQWGVRRFFGAAAVTQQFTDMTSQSRRSFRARFCQFVPPSSSEGAGNAGRPMRPIAACAGIVEMRTRVSQVTPENARHSPRNGFTAYFALSPVTGFLATVASENLFSLT
jgi:hypothetical protein